ncbi:MAG: DUF411 domain-containing protein [Candidatus Tyrphobacter sp.]
MFDKALPNLREEVVSIVAEGDRVACEVVETATFTGPMELPTGAIKPTNRGCCETLSYWESGGFSIDVRNEDVMAPIKKRFGISASLESCYTAVIDGYVIEGHVPREAISSGC